MPREHEREREAAEPAREHERAHAAASERRGERAHERRRERQEVPQIVSDVVAGGDSEQRRGEAPDELCVVAARVREPCAVPHTQQVTAVEGEEADDERDRIQQRRGDTDLDDRAGERRPRRRGDEPVVGRPPQQRDDERHLAPRVEDVRL